MPPGHPSILLKSNLFNIAAVSVKRSVLSQSTKPQIALAMNFLSTALLTVRFETFSTLQTFHKWCDFVIGKEECNSCDG